MENGTENACHGSDSTASAEREIALMFPPVRVKTVAHV
jgi:nucleoside diphosphate kinase